MIRPLQLAAIPVLMLAGLASSAEEKPIADKDVGAFVDQRVKAWAPTAAERRFDEIGWAKDIREAEQLAKEHGRLVFLFTHDGHMAVGRC
jgi:hypothetical protein